MTVTIDITTEEQARVEASGIDLANLLHGIIASLPDVSPEPSKDKAIQFFQDKVKNALADPKEIKEAEEELAAFQRQLNQNRIELGDRPILT
jgi:hypothetical protein